MLWAGLRLAPLGVLVAAMAPVAARSNGRIGPRWTLAISCAVIVLAYAFAIAFSNAVWQLVVTSTVNGVDIGFGYSAMPTLITRAVPASQTASANGLNTVMRALGTTIAAAVVGAVLAADTVPAAAPVGAVLTLLVPRTVRAPLPRPQEF